jgi:hypothetical protein
MSRIFYMVSYMERNNDMEQFVDEKVHDKRRQQLRFQLPSVLWRRRPFHSSKSDRLDQFPFSFRILMICNATMAPRRIRPRTSWMAPA